MEPGYFKGEKCNRDGCIGIIDEHKTDSGCSCHINPPCTHCVDDRHYCPECEWQGINDQYPERKNRGLKIPFPPITNGLVGFYAGKMDEYQWNDLSGNNNHLKMHQ